MLLFLLMPEQSRKRRRCPVKNIDVPEEVYARLQKHAVPLEDTVADVIDRALDALEAQKPSSHEPSQESTKIIAMPESHQRDLVSHVGRVPHGTKLRTIYLGKEYQAEVRDGSVIWSGQYYTSLSQAAVAVIQSTGSPRPTENGWRFWQYYTDTTGEWRSLWDFRAA